jgi:hypothetical protein
VLKIKMAKPKIENETSKAHIYNEKQRVYIRMEVYWQFYFFQLNRTTYFMTDSAQT